MNHEHRSAESRRRAFPLRLDARLYEELRRWADAELRSMNGQIEFLLRRAVAERRRRAEVEDRGGDPEAEPGR